MIRALIFDFDGLILDTETPLVRAWSQVHADAGLEFDVRAGQQIIGHADIPFDPWSAFGPDADVAQLETAFQRHKEVIVREQPILPGVIDLLEFALSRGLQLAVASNSDHRHVDGHLARLKLDAYFKTTVCRDDVKNPKPAPDVYLAACTQLGVSPIESVALEDSAPGHAAAHAAGLRVVVVPNPSTRHNTFPFASLQLESLADLTPFALFQRFS
jgi:putative hydrolase of the HAD superfamily